MATCLCILDISSPPTQKDPTRNSETQCNLRIAYVGHDGTPKLNVILKYILQNGVHRLKLAWKGRLQQKLNLRHYRHNCIRAHGYSDDKKLVFRIEKLPTDPTASGCVGCFCNTGTTGTLFCLFYWLKKNYGQYIASYWIMVLTDPSQLGHSLEGNGKWRSTLEGRWTNSARFSVIASAIFSAVAFSPLQKYW